MVVELYDTTLRDGAQGHGISFSVLDKVRFVKELDNLGVSYVEGGWPGSNPKDVEFFGRMSRIPLKNTTLTAFGSTCRPGSIASEDTGLRALLNAHVSTVAIVGKSCESHVISVLETSLAENLRMISDTVAFLAEKDFKVIFDAEHFFDGFRSNPEYAVSTLEAALAAGAETIVLCDTNGGTMPDELLDTIASVQDKIDAPLGIHAHDDSGIAVANSLLATSAGVQHIQGTFNGYGERCGNADLCTLIPNLQIKMGLSCIPEENLGELTRVSRWVSELANVSHRDSQPFVGSNAFAHKGGLHVSALSKDSRAYEHIDPAQVGNTRRVLISDLSGRSNVLSKVQNRCMALSKDDPQAEEILTKVKELEHQGYQFEGAEGSFELLVNRVLHSYRSLFSLEGFRVIVDKHGDSPVMSEATIKVRVGRETVHTAAEGNGPVNALDNALRKALQGIYPEMAGIRLVDYKVRVIDGQDGTKAKVRVLIESGSKGKKWGTVGVSPNIIEASWQALVDSVEYGLLVEGR